MFSCFDTDVINLIFQSSSSHSVLEFEEWVCYIKDDLSKFICVLKSTSWYVTYPIIALFAWEVRYGIVDVRRGVCMCYNICPYQLSFLSLINQSILSLVKVQIEFIFLFIKSFFDEADMMIGMEEKLMF